MKKVSRCLCKVIVSIILLIIINTTLCFGSVDPSAYSFEIDGDYGSTISSTGITDDGGLFANGKYQGSGVLWTHLTDNTYKGGQMYKARCTASPGAGNDRSEHQLLTGWYREDGSRYFSLSLYIPSWVTKDNTVILAQLHQDGTLPPPLRLKWLVINGQDILEFYQAHDNYNEDPDGARTVYEEPLIKDKWYHLLFKLKPGLDATGCINIYQLNLETGCWEERYVNDATTVGYRYKGDGSGQLAEQVYDWKTGIYRATSQLTTEVYYDNIKYGKTWNALTNNRLIGAQKCVLNLFFDESSGTTASDSCWVFNGGSQGSITADYNNDGALINGPTWSSGGVSNNCLYFDGVNDYVEIPLDIVDFDYGNYLTYSCWFKTSSDQTNKVLMCQDLYTSGSEIYKSRFYFGAANTMVFSVRHPDGTKSDVIGTTASSLCNGQWHHIIGTYNRYDAQGNRIKIYIDGQLKNQATGYDKPIWRGNTNLYIGRWSSSLYYQGYIDEVAVFNYAMSQNEAENYYW